MLMNMLRNRAKTSEIEDAIQQDDTISCQLLRYMNSPANGLMQQASSISGALETLGHDMFYRWLTLLLFFQERPEHSHITLLENALMRGRLTELFGQQNRSATETIELFVTGMFSQLDLLFKIPLEMVLNHFDLSAPVKQTLLEHNGPYAPFLKLAIACEDHDQTSIEKHAAMAGVSIELVKTTYVNAVVWVHEIDY